MGVATRDDDTLVRILEPHKGAQHLGLKKGLPRIKKVMRIPLDDDGVVDGQRLHQRRSGARIELGGRLHRHPRARPACRRADASSTSQAPGRRHLVGQACFAGSPALPVRLDYFDEKGARPAP
ncbi:MAG: hypothetical protein R3F43_02745 [bacterium]